MSIPLEERRATALRLSRDGLPLRAIAEQLGTSKDTVSRDIKAAERDEVRQADETPSPPPAPSRDAAPAPETPVARQRPRLLLELDDQLCRDLATLTRTGVPARAAIRFALAFVADGYRRAWESGAYPDGVAPDRVAMRMPPYDSRATPGGRRATGGET
ncbi:helix-turn-helix domain-containing protein [Streptomyces wuyuanensis]|uniref:helix-turn-helix domain-containing protein n=1 Tax=Streptomyces wuyuanensis TaxID=1196353 RepID=UPI003418F71F